jgi:2-phospho-L-lactate/phosphoenolpyruvate guanylyltransferase
VVLVTPATFQRNDSVRSAACNTQSQLRAFGLLPFRGLEHAKSRLSSRLSDEERQGLALELLNRAMAAMLAGGVDRLAVVTLDAELANAGLDARADLLLQTHGGLNAAIRQGQQWALAGAADALLVLLPDLPLLEADDVRAILAAATRDSAVIAPDRHATGTNALLLAPPDAIMPAFGEGSAARHRLALALADVPVTDLQRPGTHLDLDTPDDLRHLQQLGYDVPLAVSSR